MKEWIKELKKLRLPSDEYAVFGSGPIAVRGIRKARDLDIIVKKNLWRRLKKEHKVKYKQDSVDKNRKYKIIQIPTPKGIIDVFDEWHKPDYDIDELIKEADIIYGVRFVKLKRVLEWKKLGERKKDKKDVKLIEEYLNNK